MSSQTCAPDLTDFTVVNAYEPVPRMGAVRLLPHVTEAMRAAGAQTLDVHAYRDTTQRFAAERLGFSIAVAVAGARAGLTLAARLASRRRPEASLAVVYTPPRTMYSVFITADGLKRLETSVGEEPMPVMNSDIAVASITLRAGGNDLDEVLRIRSFWAARGISLLIDAAVAPWRELAPLASDDALVVTSGSKHEGGPSTSGFLLAGECWAAEIHALLSELPTESLRPGKEVLAGLNALLAASARPPVADVPADDRQAAAILRKMGFGCHSRRPFWLGGPPADGFIYSRAFSEPEGAATAASRVASILWNLEPPIVVGCVGDSVHVSLDRLSALERSYVVAALSSAIKRGLPEAGDAR